MLHQQDFDHAHFRNIKHFSRSKKKDAFEKVKTAYFDKSNLNYRLKISKNDTRSMPVFQNVRGFNNRTSEMGTFHENTEIPLLKKPKNGFRNPDFCINMGNLKPEDREKLRVGIDKSKKYFYDTVEELIDDANNAFKTRDRAKTIKIITIICNITVKIPEYQLLIKTLRIATQIFIYFRDWDSSIFCLEKLRDVCIMSRDFNTVMVVFKQAGMIFQHMKDYSRAIICFK